MAGDIGILACGREPLDAVASYLNLGTTDDLQVERVAGSTDQVWKLDIFRKEGCLRCAGEFVAGGAVLLRAAPPNTWNDLPERIGSPAKDRVLALRALPIVTAVIEGEGRVVSRIVTAAMEWTAVAEGGDSS